jgi:hypothetical protein
MQSAALAALLALTPAHLSAQETEAPEGGEATGTLEPGDPTEPAAETEMAEETEAPVEPVEGAITLQGENTVLANELLGATVFVEGDETAGDIADMIINLDGTVEGVVIGVGGFLGLGEKRVAVEASQLSIEMDENNQPRLFLNATREELEAAPEFTTAEQQRQDAETVVDEPIGAADADAPAMTEEADPAMTEEADPAMTEETDPAMEEETAPASE